MDRELQAPLSLECKGTGIPEAWFLGPQAENLELLRELIGSAIDSHAAFRRAFHLEDPTHVTMALRRSPEFEQGVERLRAETAKLLEKLQMSAPFASMRHQGHMLRDQAMPATVGLFAALLYKQNSVAAEASPVTTRIEIEAGNDLCRYRGALGGAEPKVRRGRAACGDPGGAGAGGGTRPGGPALGRGHGLRREHGAADRSRLLMAVGFWSNVGAEIWISRTSRAVVSLSGI